MSTSVLLAVVNIDLSAILRSARSRVHRERRRSVAPLTVLGATLRADYDARASDYGNDHGL
jgi:hypothetical protein